MIDNLDQTDRLLCKLEKSLPIAGLIYIMDCG
jgi:hypothetical protein